MNRCEDAILYGNMHTHTSHQFARKFARRKIGRSVSAEGRRDSIPQTQDDDQWIITLSAINIHRRVRSPPVETVFRDPPAYPPPDARRKTRFRMYITVINRTCFAFIHADSLPPSTRYGRSHSRAGWSTVTCRRVSPLSRLAVAYSRVLLPREREVEPVVHCE